MYQGLTDQFKKGKAGAPDKAAEQMQPGFPGEREAGAVYDRSSALDSIVGDKIKSMTEGAQNLGKTVGNPQLSENAQKYYEQLKAKFGDMDFILVSSEEKANAMANAGNYANPDKPVVLIGADEVEKMANDEKFREKYEGIISMAKENLASMKDQFGNDDNVKGYGMQVNDKGEVSYFAVLKKSGEMQAERIQEKRAENKAERKAEAKKEAKEEQTERLERVRNARSEKAREAYGEQEDFGYEIIRADSVDELASLVSGFLNPASEGTNSQVGGNIDFTA